MSTNYNRYSSSLIVIHMLVMRLKFVKVDNDISFSLYEDLRRECMVGRYYYGFQTVCKCPFWALLVTLVTDSNQTWAN